MHARVVGTVLIATTAITSLAIAAPLPDPVKGATVSTAVTTDAASGLFRYRYRVANDAGGRSAITSLELDLTLSPNEARLSREGLINGSGYRRVTSEANFQQVPMVPVGISTPTGWTSGLGITPAATEGYASWGSRDAPFDILPGKMLTGLALDSRGLPGIREVRLQPPVPYGDLPDEYDDPDELAKFVETLIFRTKTVGPKAPPAKFVAIEFLNYLIALLHDSRQQGWVRTEGIHKSLLAKLLAAKRALEAGRGEAARGELGAFLNEVRGVACPDFSCPGNKPLTSEAYALLYFNGQYLRDRI